MAFPPRRPKRWTEADIAPEHEAILSQIFGRLLILKGETHAEDNERPVLVRLTPSAKDLWVQYYNTHNIEQADLTDEMAAAWAKLEEAAARLAVVVHYLRWAGGGTDDELLLSEEAMAAGIALAEWFKREARRVYAMFGESEEQRDQRRLIEWIRARGGRATAREVQQGCRWLKESGAAEAALEKLAKSGLGYWEIDHTNSRRGRPSRVFVLSTSSTSTKFDKTQEIHNSVDVDTVDSAESDRPPNKCDQGGMNYEEADCDNPQRNNNRPKADAVNAALAEAAEEGWEIWEVWGNERS
jgi:hypothetical protein